MNISGRSLEKKTIMYAKKLNYSRILKKLCHLSLIIHHARSRQSQGKAKQEGTGKRNIVRVRSHISRMESHICCCFLVPRRQREDQECSSDARGKSCSFSNPVKPRKLSALLLRSVLFLIDFQRSNAPTHNLQGKIKKKNINPLSSKTIH